MAQIVYLNRATAIDWRMVRAAEAADNAVAGAHEVVSLYRAAGDEASAELWAMALDVLVALRSTGYGGDHRPTQRAAKERRAYRLADAKAA